MHAISPCGIEQARAEFDVVPYHCGGIPCAYFAYKLCAGAPPLGGETAVEYIGQLLVRAKRPLRVLPSARCMSTSQPMMASCGLLLAVSITREQCEGRMVSSESKNITHGVVTASGLVAGGCRAGSVAVEHSYGKIGGVERRLPARKFLASAVGGVVVDQNYIERPCGLRLKRVQGASHKLFPVVYRYDYGQKLFHRSVCSCSEYGCAYPHKVRVSLYGERIVVAHAH